VTHPLLLIAAALLPAAQASDAPQALPDPATVKVPDIVSATDPKVREDGYKFYYFYSPEVSFAEAYQDLLECRGYLMTGGAQIPGFVPWEPAKTPSVAAFGHTGQVLKGNGSLLAMVIIPKAEHGIRSNKMRRCMETRGYARYAVPEATWSTLNDGDPQETLLMQAKLASGARPTDKPVIDE
jgi:hypothetical protein